MPEGKKKEGVAADTAPLLLFATTPRTDGLTAEGDRHACAVAGASPALSGQDSGVWWRSRICASSRGRKGLQARAEAGVLDLPARRGESRGPCLDGDPAPEGLRQQSQEILVDPVNLVTHEDTLAVLEPPRVERVGRLRDVDMTDFVSAGDAEQGGDDLLPSLPLPAEHQHGQNALAATFAARRDTVQFRGACHGAPFKIQYTISRDSI